MDFYAWLFKVVDFYAWVFKSSGLLRVILLKWWTFTRDFLKWWTFTRDFFSRKYQVIKILQLKKRCRGVNPPPPLAGLMDWSPIWLHPGHLFGYFSVAHHIHACLSYTILLIKAPDKHQDIHVLQWLNFHIYSSVHFSIIVVLLFKNIY